MTQTQPDIKAIKESWLEPLTQAPDPIIEFLTHLFEQTDGSNLRGLIARAVANLAYGVCGTEIEGEEISLGMMFVGTRDAFLLGMNEAAISSSIRSEWQGKAISPNGLLKFDLKVLRKVLNAMRDNILGWTPGYYDHPMLIFSWNKGRNLTLDLKGSTILSCEPHVVDVESAYTTLSKPSRLAIWVKPHHTIRIYYAGRFLGHVVKLRDTNLWALRSFQHLRRFLTSSKTMKQEQVPRIISEGQVDKLLLALMAISEEKKGAALYIMNKDRFEDAVKKIRTTKAKDNASEYLFLSRWKHRVQECESFNIATMPLGELLTYLRQDGSVVIDEDGNWLAAGVYFNTSGGRKGSARDIAREHGGHIFLVSQDGGLFFYSQAITNDYRTPPPDESPEGYPEVRLDFLPIDEDDLRLTRAIRRQRIPA